MTTTWFTADLHLGHRNIISYCERPFLDAAEMNDALIEGWRTSSNRVGSVRIESEPRCRHLPSVG